MTKASRVRRRVHRAWLILGVALALLIAVGSLWPSLPQAASGMSDKFLHFSAYAALAFLWAGAWEPRAWLRVAVGLLLFGAAIELAQELFTETRSGEWLDMVANAAGIATGMAVAALMPERWARRLELALGFGAERP